MANRNIRPHERFIFGIIALGGVFALVFGISHFGQRLKAPYRPKGLKYTSLEQREALAEAALRIKDTDNDGLTDYEEINVWQTSAYLADTDSDGFDDKQEVESGNNPTCPAGKEAECLGAQVLQGEEEQGVGVRPPSDLAPVTPEAVSPSEVPDLQSIFSNATPEQIRELLREQGVADDHLKKFDDAALMKLYRESFQDAIGAATTEAERTRQSSPATSP